MPSARDYRMMNESARMEIRKKNTYWWEERREKENSLFLSSCVHAKTGQKGKEANKERKKTKVEEFFFYDRGHRFSS